MSKPISVTEAIKNSGVGPDYSMVSEAYLSFRAASGKAVQSLWEDAMKNGTSLPNTEDGRYAARLVEWFRGSGAKLVRGEHEVRGRLAGIDYVGHPDLEVIWRGELLMLDIKRTAQLFSSYGLQTAAYRHAAILTDGKKRGRGILWLPKDGQARLVCEPPICRPTDQNMFGAILTSQNWIKGAKL